MFKSIFRRLFFSHLLVLLAGLLVTSSVVTLFVSNYTLQTLTDDCITSAKLIEKWTGLYQIDNYTVRSTHTYKEKLNDCSALLNCDIFVVNLKGDVFDSTTRNTLTHIDMAYLTQIKENKIFRETGNFRGLYTYDVFTVGVPLKYQGTIIGAIFFNNHMPDINKIISHMSLMFVGALLAAAIVACLSVYFQAKKISNQLRRINSAALDIAAGNFPEKLPITSKDEIGQLSSSFNFMSTSLQKLENMRNRFLSDVSHELRTPMTSISGFIEGILDGTIPPEKHKEYLKIAHYEASRLARLVNDMLEMSKMSSSEYKLNTSDFDFNELIRLCIISLEQKIDYKQIDLDIDFASDDLKVCADRDAIQRVLINLLDNAIKFSHSGTTVKISSRIENKKAFFSIGNYGEPISREDLSHIFDRFYKTDTARGDHKTGAGLGLSFVKNIMLLHKQKIWVKSTPEKDRENVNYTEFTFTLELA